MVVCVCFYAQAHYPMIRWLEPANLLVMVLWNMGSFLPINIKSRTFRRKQKSGSFRYSVVSVGSFRPESLWLIFGPSFSAVI